jgi:hypothetical protein
MTTKQVVAVIVTTFAFAAAASLAVVTGHPSFMRAGSARSPVPATVLSNRALSQTKPKDGKSDRTCQAGQDSAKPSAGSGVTDPHKVLVVACEQPPRSNVVLPSASNSLPSVLGGGG